ncbi:class I SAM-dependent methyltransferase [Gluconacetobacter azotocaptans]|uniref:Class I SAM-dependent methyltransferase n=1 Tax=Gluconacetobacter azotocaptans TaxID=142834 RepID=A0A7W4PG55_9PROT|nr:class I SAM-dependent methyltransferase [Gluconacetobacter azotocaptans]MBB2191264.1 class I SAM-dependent methyltransferase [Gluconacetobacter azotocaptans]GBQ25743.1 putative methyltransferase [Gluconacetobacter azotocaptans DSM 13594]
MTARRSFVIFAVVAALGAGAAVPASAQSALSLSRRGTSVGIAAALGNRDRPEADRAADANRKPAALLAFAGLRRGMNVADIMPGRGYFTRIFSNVVGADGHVWAVVPAERVAKKPDAADAVKAIAADASFGNVTVLVQPLDAISIPKPLDLAWTSQNYHDVYYGSGADAALALDKAVFAALRRGGIFMVVDHVANPGMTPDAVRTLHRIDPALIRRQVEAVGFHFEGESKVLANGQDTHSLPVFDPSIRGHTDQVVLKFRKP